MEGVAISNKKIKKRFDILSDLYLSQVPEQYIKLIKIIILRYKQYSENEYYILFILIYGLVFFKVINISNSLLTEKDRKNLKLVKESYHYDLSGDMEKYIQSMALMNDDLFQLKMVLKYTLIVSEDRYIKLVTNIDNYYKSIGYIIPYLTLKESKLLGFFQDIYFKKIYTKEYQKTKDSYLKATSSIELPGEYMIGIVNDITEIMSRAEVMGKIKVRKKSYFSLYNKMQRKDYDHFSDSIGVRIIFDKKGDLKKFVKKFEGINICLKKKDYIQKPKRNGYQSIHYMYPSFYRSTEILVELQLRTKKMDNLIHNIRTISHFDYTVKENKWSDLFSEVIDGYEYTMKIIEQEKEKKLHKHEQSSKKTSS